MNVLVKKKKGVGTERDKKSAYLLGVPFTIRSLGEILTTMDARIKARASGYISITNAESLYYAQKIASFNHYIQNAEFSCCDGIAVRIAGKFFKLDIPRLPGPDLLLKCCQFGVDKGWRHFFYGGKAGVPEMLAKKLTQKFPGMITCGTYSPPFRELSPSEDAAVTNMLIDARPDIVWVGLGLLKQERWIEQHWQKVAAPWMIGVGAAFDFYSETIKRAPKSFQDAGIEWLYRFISEPRRMFIRDIYSLSIFYPVFKHLISLHIYVKKNSR